MKIDRKSWHCRLLRWLESDARGCWIAPSSSGDYIARLGRALCLLLSLVGVVGFLVLQLISSGEARANFLRMLIALGILALVFAVGVMAIAGCVFVFDWLCGLGENVDYSEPNGDGE